MVEMGSTVSIVILGLFLFIVAVIVLAVMSFDRIKQKSIFCFLIILAILGLLIFGFSFHQLGCLTNLGRPMTFALLKDGPGYEIMGAIGKFTIVSFNNGRRVEIRTVFDFPNLPKKLEIGDRFSKRGNQITEEIRLPKEVPKVGI